MDVMIDLETYSNTPNSVIVQIGAVEFNRQTGETLRNFKTNVDAQSCIDHGMEVNIDTINWWMSQPDKARKSILKDGINIKEALSKFTKFIKTVEEEPRNVILWCHATFDEPILSNAYNRVGIEEPWHYRSVRDLRTLIDLADVDPYTYQNNGTHHDALADCRFQIRYTVDALNKLKGV